MFLRISKSVHVFPFFHLKAMANDAKIPLNYFAAYKPIRDLLPKDILIVNEGANTMDIGRTMLPNDLPKRRLDAGSFGTMGVGLGFGIAAAFFCRDHRPSTRVLCVQGDSAFGFSGMEIETITRYENLDSTHKAYGRGGGWEGWERIPFSFFLPEIK